MRNSSRFLPFVILTLALLIPSLVFAGGYNLAGVGSKALAMSGAYRAIADDYSALYWNPAGLAGQGYQATLEFKTLMPLTWLRPNTAPTSAHYGRYNDGVEEVSETAFYPAGSMGDHLCSKRKDDRWIQHFRSCRPGRYLERHL